MNAAYFWNDSFPAIFGESCGAIMHHAFIVVWNPVIRHSLVVILIEVVLLTGSDVVPDDRHPLIAIGRALLMIEAECVHKLVDDGPVAQATGILKIHHLALPVVAIIGPAARGIALYDHEVFVTFFVWTEAHACLVVVILEHGLDLISL